LEIYFILFWACIPTLFLATFLGYYFGKKERTVLSPSPSADSSNELLHDRGVHTIQKYEMVTVLFADIVGFSEISDSLDPELLLEELNEFFLYCDKIIDNYQVEKIKTMGDAYMCAGGISHKNYTNPVDVVMMALQLQDHQKKMMEKNPNVWSVRIGIHTGPVIAGMLGEKKLSFDIWGHTVNVAARLETSCPSGKINVSGTTYEKIKKYFDCEYNGKVPNTVDEVSSYVVKNLKSEFLQINDSGLMITNQAFFVQMQLLRLIDLEEFVVGMMKKKSSVLYFHNFEHVMDVYEHVELLARLENIDDENILMLKTAALMHDIGYSIKYDINICGISEGIARKFLPEFKYSSQQIDRICHLMKVAHYDESPQGLIEEVMHDANHMYFGRAEYNKMTMSLLRELKEHNIYVNKSDWFKSRSSRLVNHRFYTNAAKKLVKMFAEQQISNFEY